jgi:hypothetical protein
MIERIYIPTIKRADMQITFDNLPASLQEKVILVIDPAERDLYKQNVKLLELPKEVIGSWTQLAETRKFIHQHAGVIKYAMFDDDNIIIKRNSKYITGISDMEKSKRAAESSEILRLFEMADKFLDEDDVGIVGLSDAMVPPANTEYSDTKGVFNVLFLDGRKISKIIDDLDTPVRVAEDVLFLLECMSRGINTRMINEFTYANKSLSSELKGRRPVWEDIWDDMPKDYFQTDEHYDAMRIVQYRFPDAITIYEEDGRMKNTKHWKKAYKPKETSTLKGFFI